MKTTDLFGRPLNSGQSSVLGQRFRWPPFSVLNAREGDWQNRKRQWIELGIKSELGRGEALTYVDPELTDLDVYRHKEGGSRALAQSYRMDEYIDGYRPNGKANATPGGSAMPAMDYKNKERGDGRGKPLQNGKRYHAQPGGGPSKKSVWLGSSGKPVGGDGAINSGQANSIRGGLVHHMAMQPEGYENETAQSGTSIFDPVVCELFYRWFTPKHAAILDPFAGGSVRGIVASVLGRDYVGVDLRPEQIAANEAQAARICKADEEPIWLHGDSRNIAEIVKKHIDDKTRFDAIFSCPPYFDLELYSGDKRDLSNTTWREFCEAYSKIIEQSVSLLKPNRFACFVVGDIRDKKGFYRSLPALTTECFEAAGCHLYNEALLVTAVGSLPLRIHAQFTKSRKLGRTHQSILIYVKGDPVKASAACEDIKYIAADTAHLRESAGIA